MHELLVCPSCRGKLEDGDGQAPVLVCETCRVEYPVKSGIPVLLSPELQRSAPSDGSPFTHKAQQIAFSDQEVDEFNVTRPRGAPALYEHLMREKFRRSVIGLEGLLEGSTVLVTCAGPGMDAEFLVQAGARVILSDISHGALMQARERSRRYGLDLALVVADAEALPFRNSSVDVVYVHDGLHHLQEPALGLSEMTRVARRAISVSEPAKSFATNVAVHLRIAEEVEEPGNPVMRLTLEEIVRELGKHGFRPIKPHRYAMFYRHWPGRPMRMLSLPVALPVAATGLNLTNQVLGRFGNKLAVQAVRMESD